MTTPRHGDRALHIVHMDHTQSDVETIDPNTGESLGRPWHSYAVDAYTRRVLAVWISYDRPSYRTCMMLIRIIVQRYLRVPQIVVVDNGPEFRSTYFDTLLAAFGITKKLRPAAKARFGSPVERLFGTTDTEFIHNLLGNTQITKRVRLVTKHVNPKHLAVWTLLAFYERLCVFAYEVYDTMVHPALGMSPRAAFEESITMGGERRHRFVRYDNDFRRLTMPTTRTGIATVKQNAGVKIESIYYNCDALQADRLVGTTVAVRFDPADKGLAWALVQGEWVECHSEHYNVFRGRSEREVRQATQILRAREKAAGRSFKPNGQILGEFLRETAKDEELLKLRKLDLLQHEIVSLIEAGPSVPAMIAAAEAIDLQRQRDPQVEQPEVAPVATSEQVESEQVEDEDEIPVCGRFIA